MENNKKTTDINYNEAISYMKKRADGVPDFRNGEFIEELYRANIKILTKLEEQDSLIKDLPDSNKMETLYDGVVELLKKINLMETNQDDLRNDITNLGYTVNAINHKLRNSINTQENKVEGEQEIPFTKEQKIGEFILLRNEEFVSKDIQKEFDMDRNETNVYLRRLTKKDFLEFTVDELTKAKKYKIKDLDRLKIFVEGENKDHMKQKRIENLKKMISK